MKTNTTKPAAAPKAAAKTKNSQYATSRNVQLTYIGVIGGAYVLQVAFVTYNMLQTLRFNHNLSSYYTYFLSQFALPVLILAAAFWLNPRQLTSKLNRTFESFLIACMSMMAYWGIWQWLYTTFGSLFPLSDSQWAYFRQELMIDTLVLVVVIGILLAIRARRSR